MTRFKNKTLQELRVMFRSLSDCESLLNPHCRAVVDNNNDNDNDNDNDNNDNDNDNDKDKDKDKTKKKTKTKTM